jgi:hypothetical protein
MEARNQCTGTWEALSGGPRISVLGIQKMEWHKEIMKVLLNLQ